MTSPDGLHRCAIDHLVVMADSLDAGTDWCRSTLGVAPAMGGEHPLMGTHNRLLQLSGPAHPRAYLEVIAINPGAKNTLAAGARRWFDMDDEALQAMVRSQGPQLTHWVASVPDLAAARSALAGCGLDRGEIVQASRPTPLGLLQWQITLRPDGRRLLDGCLPTLIQWGDRHPCYSLPASGVTLRSLQLEHPQAPLLARACTAAGLQQRAAIAFAPEPRILATLETPRGIVQLASPAAGAAD